MEASSHGSPSHGYCGVSPLLCEAGAMLLCLLTALLDPHNQHSFSTAVASRLQANGICGQAQLVQYPWCNKVARPTQ